MFTSTWFEPSGGQSEEPTVYCLNHSTSQNIPYVYLPPLSKRKNTSNFSPLLYLCKLASKPYSTSLLLSWPSVNPSFISVEENFFQVPTQHCFCPSLIALLNSLSHLQKKHHDSSYHPHHVHCIALRIQSLPATTSFSSLHPSKYPV